MMKKFTFLFAIISCAYLGNAQIQKLTDTKYYMYLKPFLGSLRGSSDLTHDINPNFTLESRGLLMGIDWVSGRWTNVDEALVPKIQVPIKIRYMGAKDMKGLKINDGTCFPEEPGVDTNDNPRKPFDYLDFSFDLYYSPISFKLGSTVLTPKIGIDIDLARHEYDIDVSKFLGKDGTYANLQADINNSYSSFYSYTFWEDLLGFNAGLYINFGKRVFVDLGYEYYPVRFMTKFIGNSINTNWDAMPGTSTSTSTKLSKFNVEGQFRIVS